MSGGSPATDGAAGAGASVPPVLPVPAYWDITGTVTEIDPPPTENVGCSSISFTLDVDQPQGQLRFTAGSNGRIDAVSGEIRDGAYVAHLLTPVMGYLEVCGANEIRLTDLELSGIDLDGDGVADQLTGTAGGFAVFGFHDLNQPITVKLAGTKDQTAPTLSQPGTFNPLYPPVFAASEPLAPDAEFHMVGPTITTLDAISSPIEPPPVHPDDVSEFSPSEILPLGGTWALWGKAHDPSGLFLGGRSDVHEVQDLLYSSKDRGAQAEDGFEGVLTAIVELGAPTLVTGVGPVPAISGAHSLFLQDNAALTLHLKRAPGTKNVHFSYRVFARTDSYIAAGEVRAGVIGGTHPTILAQGELKVGIISDSGDDNWRRVGELQQVDVPLNDEGPDVLLHLAGWLCNPWPATPWLADCQPDSALLVDDLSVQ